MKKGNFTPAKVVTRNGDTTKEWYCEFSYFDQSTGNYKRFRERGTANRTKDGNLRIKILKELNEQINKRLFAGWNPFTNQYSEVLTLNTTDWLSCAQIVLNQVKSKSGERNFEQYTQILNKFTRYLEIRNMDRINPALIDRNTIEQYLDYRLLQKIKPGTRNKDLAILQRTFKILFVMGAVPKNPTIGIEKLRTSPVAHRAYDDATFTRIVNYMNEQPIYKQAYIVLVLCAIRPIEILRLKVKDLDRVKGIVTVANENSKNDKFRYVKIPELFMQVIRDWDISNYPNNYYLFNPAGLPSPSRHTNRTYWSKYFAKIKRALNLEKYHTMYGLKHTVLTMLYKNGAALNQLMDYGGFKSLDALQAYLRRNFIQVPEDMSSFINLPGIENKLS